jgi:peptidoglycan/xylan/chitin deacetylase (PgdA/CDA1 family)
MTKTPTLLLSFDVEEFDMPLEYGKNIPEEEQFRTGKEGMVALIPLLKRHRIPCTLFTTACYALRFPEQIRELGIDHEIASHTFHHSRFEIADLLRSRETLEQIIGKPVTGLRMPRMRPVHVQDVLDAGYRYDASINPTWLPGRYNNLHLPRQIYREQQLIRVPASVSPNLRIPLFWLSFKNLPYSLYLNLARQTLRRDGWLCLYFHPWEFTDISHSGIPGYTRKPCGPRLLDRLDKLITDLKQEAGLQTIYDFLEHQENLRP